MTRHQRRKAGQQRLADKMADIALANAAYERALLVKANLSRPKERNYYPQSSMADLKGQSHRAYVCHN